MGPYTFPIEASNFSIAHNPNTNPTMIKIAAMGKKKPLQNFLDLSIFILFIQSSFSEVCL